MSREAVVPSDVPGLDLDACPALHASRVYSQALIAALEPLLARAARAAGLLDSIVAGGSVGRLEASPHSDFDGILIFATRSLADPAGTAACIEAILALLAAQGLKPPKPWGIYRSPVTAAALCDPAALGSLAERPDIFGKRMQILLDARPLYGAAAFRQLRRQVLEWYATGARRTPRQWSHLIDDLMRYVHAYSAWQRFKFERTPDDGWYLRQAKLQSTRLLTFAGLLLLLGASSAAGTNELEWLEAKLDLTPLERVALVMGDVAPQAFATVLECYEAIHARLLDEGVRAALVAAEPDTGTALRAADPPAYRIIAERSQRLLAVITEFVLERRGDWALAFFSDLIF